MRRSLIATATSVILLGLMAGPAAAGWKGKSKQSPPAGSVVDVVVDASGGGTPDRNPRDYDILVQAVLATGLAPVLADTSQTYTVFGPNDRAFKRLVRELSGRYPRSEQAALDAITSTLSLEQIKDVLLYHVVAGKRLSPLQVVFSRSLTMANGGTIKPRFLRLHDANDAFRDPRLVIRGLNIPASNGVIHTIDRVLVPAL